MGAVERSIGDCDFVEPGLKFEVDEAKRTELSWRVRWRRWLFIEGQEAGAQGRSTKQRSVDN
jgi:hypothetical protein